MATIRALFEARRKLFWVFTLAVLVLDQVSKLLLWHPPAAQAAPVVLIPNVLRLIAHPGNTRGALGLGPQSPVFYVLAAAVGLGVIGYFLLTAPARNGLLAAALGMIAGGAVGNLIDRVALRYVRDFIELHWKEALHWHTFNVADAAICIGFVLVVCDMLFFSARQEEGGAEARCEAEA